MKPGDASDHETPEPIPGNLRRGQTEIWRRYQVSGPGDSSEEELTRNYLHLVKTVIGRLAINLPRHVSVEDLYSAGLIGLLNAIRNFNPKLGTVFEPYARMRIRGAALDELRRMDWVPRSVHTKARKVQTAMETFERTHGRLPDEDETAQALGITSAEYEKLMEDIRPVTFVCLDAAEPNQSGDDTSEHENIPADSGEDTLEWVSKRELAAVIRERIQQLPLMHRKVLALYYFEDLRLREIAEVTDLCESRICQIHSQAILAIRSHVEQFEARRQGGGEDKTRMAA